MPMLDSRRNVHHITGGERLYGLTPLLIATASGNADENLSAATRCLVDVPVVAATRLKGHIVDFDLFCR